MAVYGKSLADPQSRIHECAPAATNRNRDRRPSRRQGQGYTGVQWTSSGSG